MTADNPSRVSGAAQQVETRREEVEAIVGPAVAFYSAADDVVLVAAERRIIEVARHVVNRPNTWRLLRDALENLDSLRTVRESKP